METVPLDFSPHSRDHIETWIQPVPMLTAATAIPEFDTTQPDEQQ